MATLTPLPHRHGQNIRDKASYILSSVLDIKHHRVKIRLMRGVELSDIYHDLSLSRAHLRLTFESRLPSWMLCYIPCVIDKCFVRIQLHFCLSLNFWQAVLNIKQKPPSPPRHDIFTWHEHGLYERSKIVNGSSVLTIIETPSVRLPIYDGSSFNWWKMQQHG